MDGMSLIPSSIYARWPSAFFDTLRRLVGGRVKTAKEATWKIPSIKTSDVQRSWNASDDIMSSLYHILRQAETICKVVSTSSRDITQRNIFSRFNDARNDLIKGPVTADTYDQVKVLRPRACKFRSIASFFCRRYYCLVPCTAKDIYDIYKRFICLFCTCAGVQND